jgi:hypothetical protein
VGRVAKIVYQLAGQEESLWRGQEREESLFMPERIHIHYWIGSQVVSPTIFLMSLNSAILCCSDFDFWNSMMNFYLNSSKVCCFHWVLNRFICSCLCLCCYLSCCTSFEFHWVLNRFICSCLCLCCYLSCCTSFEFHWVLNRFICSCLCLCCYLSCCTSF